MLGLNPAVSNERPEKYFKESLEKTFLSFTILWSKKKIEIRYFPLKNTQKTNTVSRK